MSKTFMRNRGETTAILAVRLEKEHVHGNDGISVWRARYMHDKGRFFLS